MKKRFGKRRRPGAACAVLLCLLLAGSVLGCHKEKSLETENPKYVIGIVTKSRDSEYWMSVCSGMEKAAADLGVSVIIMSPDTETDEKARQQMIDSLLKKDIDALAVSPIDSYNAKEYLKKAEKKHITVVSYDTKIMEKGVPYIGIDNEKAGRDLAEYLAGQMEEKGSVGIISGNLKQSSHAARLKGFNRKEHTYPNSLYRKRVQQSEDVRAGDLKTHEGASGLKRDLCHQCCYSSGYYGVSGGSAGTDCHRRCTGGRIGCRQKGKDRCPGLPTRL